MKAEISKNMLQRIARDIQAGRVLWALFTANEYFTPSDPVRIALVVKAKPSLEQKNYQGVTSLVVAACRGKTVANLKPCEKLAFKSLTEKPLPRRRYYQFSYSGRQILDLRKKARRLNNSLPGALKRVKRIKHPPGWPNFSQIGQRVKDK